MIWKNIWKLKFTQIGWRHLFDMMKKEGTEWEDYWADSNRDKYKTAYPTLLHFWPMIVMNFVDMFVTEMMMVLGLYLWLTCKKTKTREQHRTYTYGKCLFCISKQHSICNEWCWWLNKKIWYTKPHTPY